MAPSVMAGVNAVVVPGATLLRVGSFSDPGVTESYTATIDYGDGTGVQPLAYTAARTFAIDHAYSQLGLFNVTVTVTDQYGGVGAGSFAVTVIRPPITPGPVMPPPNIDLITLDPVTLGRYAFVTTLYQEVLRRTPDGPGLNLWIERLAAGASPGGVVQTFFQSPEYHSLQRHHRAPHLNPVTALRDASNAGRRAAIVDTYYHDLLGRAPDAKGYDYWLTKLAIGVSPARVANGFNNSAEHRSQALRGQGTNVSVTKALNDALRNADLVVKAGAIIPLGPLVSVKPRNNSA